MSSPGFFDSPFLQGPEGYLLVENEQRLRNESYGVLALTWILLVTSWVTIVLRFYARGRVLRSIGYDDWTMLATVLCFTVYAGFVTDDYAITLKYSKQLAAGQTPSLDFAVNLNVAAFCLFIATMVLLKISLCLFFIKIFASKRTFIVIMVITTVVASCVRVANIITVAEALCSFEAFFFMDIKECGGTKPPSSAWVITTFVSTAVNIASDLLYVVLSIIVVARLQMKLRQKISTILLCVLGTIGTIASVVRLVLQLSYIPGESRFGASNLEIMCSVMELGLGIIAASCATLRPVLEQARKWYKHRRGLLSSRSNDKTGSRSAQTRDRGTFGIVSELERSVGTSGCGRDEETLSDSNTDELVLLPVHLEKEKHNSLIEESSGTSSDGSLDLGYGRR